MRWVAFPVAAAGLAASLVARDASAVGTRTFELDTLDKLSGGDLAGVSIGSDGVVRAGWTLGDVPLPEGSGTTATCALELADGSILVGTGPASGGKVVRIAGDHAAIFADTHESAVNALAVDKAGVVYAATTSNRVYQVSQGRAEIFARLPGVDAVFALATDPRNGALYAGTGSEGKVMRVAAGDASTVLFKTNEPFVVSLAVGDDGAVFAGTSGKGLLYRITAPGRATVLYDFHSEDVHAIAVGPNHTVWAIANDGAPEATTSTTSSSTHRNTGGRSVAGPNSESHGKPGKGSLWRFDSQGRPERLMHHDEFHYVSLALDDSGVPFVGTGAEGRVYSVNDAHEVRLVTDTSGAAGERHRRAGARSASSSGAIPRPSGGCSPSAAPKRCGRASPSTRGCGRDSATCTGAGRVPSRSRPARATRPRPTRRGARGARPCRTAAPPPAPRRASSRCGRACAIPPPPSPT